MDTICLPPFLRTKKTPAFAGVKSSGNSDGSQNLRDGDKPLTFKNVGTRRKLIFGEVYISHAVNDFVTDRVLGSTVEYCSRPHVIRNFWKGRSSCDALARSAKTVDIRLRVGCCLSHALTGFKEG